MSDVIHTQISERTLTVWSPPMVRVARAQADSGNLRLVADLCEELLGDDKIPAVFRTLVQSLFGKVPTFEKSSQGHGRLRNQAVKAVETGEDWWDLAPESESSLVVEWGLLLGVSFGENVAWENIRGRRVPRRRRGRNVSTLKWWHPRYFRQDENGRWICRAKEGEFYLDEEPGRWVVFTPFGSTRPWSRGLWRGMSRLYLAKSYAIDDRGRHSEKGATLSVESPEGATKELQRSVANDIDQRGTDATMVLPAGFKVAMVEVSGEATKLYDSQIGTSDNAAGVAVLGHNLTSQVDGGSHAAATVGNDVRGDIETFVAEAWSTCSHEQILAPHAGANWGDPGVAAWPVYPTKPEDTKSKADGMGAVADAAAKAKAVEPRVDVAKMLEDAGFPLLAEAPPAPPPPVAPQQPPAPPAQNAPNATP